MTPLVGYAISVSACRCATLCPATVTNGQDGCNKVTDVEILSFGNWTSINYWAVLVVGLITFFLGAIWYSPALFESAWMTANGYTRSEIEDLQSSLGPVGFGSTFLAYLAMALVLAVFTVATSSQGVMNGLALGFMMWLGFVATTSLTVNLFSTRPLSSWLIDVSFQLVAFLVAGTILAVWR